MALTTKYLIEWGIEDNAESTLDLTIGAADLSLQVDTGDGDEFPATINGTATSTGDSNTLNDTGIGASGVAVGDFIRNLTDGSYSVILSIAADTIETLPLWGGSGNTWESGDTWVVNAFVVSVEQYTTQGSPSSGVVKREKIYITQRASGSDIMTVPSGGRGYDGSTAQGFNAGDSVYLFVKDLEYQGLVNGIKNIYDRMNTAETTLSASVLLKDGSIPLNNNTTFKARNAANSANVDLFKLTASDVLEFQTLPRNPSSRSISNDYDLIDKKYFTDNLPGQTSRVAGGTITVTSDPIPVYISDGTGGRTAGRFYQADANDTTNFAQSAIYFVKESTTAGNSYTLYSGLVSGFTGLTADRVYFLDDSGVVSTTPGTTIVPLGRSVSTTEIDMNAPLSMKMADGVFTDVNVTASATTDETINLGFVPVYIEIEYYIQGHDASTSTASYFRETGKALWKGASIVNNVLYGSASSGSDNGAATTFNGNIFGSPDGSNPSAGTGGGNSAETLTTLSINSVSASGFVRRVTSTVQAAGNNSRFRGRYRAWGY